ncbi:hypothetical protein lerEdw1_014965 [Lerista edwardsae]|nr:hypothetical protein lerEdw1_014965 [Lerista edwardsae]
MSTGVPTLVTLTRTTLAVNIEQNDSLPTSPEEKSAALTMAAYGKQRNQGVIIFIAILVSIVIILVSVVSLRFKCRRCKDVDEKQKPQHPMVSFSYSDASADTDIADTDVAASKKDIVTLVSMKNLNINNNRGIMKTVVIHEEQEEDIK